jgi:NAD(P)-dependent dehydrogenase (short-subunit alcohol dehydrogenase family)
MGKSDFTGKTALITGGASGRGIRHAIALLQVGANVMLSDINSGSLEVALHSARALGK